MFHTLCFGTRNPLAAAFCVLALLCTPDSFTRAADAPDGRGKKIVFVSGRPSHGYGAHEHAAGCLVLMRGLQQGLPGVEVTLHRDGWPDDPHAFDGADAIVLYSDGGARHPILPHLEQVDRLMKQGVGLVCIHYAVEVPKDEGGPQFLDWIGGYFETFWSVNPHWTADFTEFPEHPITRGVQPFSINDEWYYHMRFPENMDGVTPILTATPPNETRMKPDHHHQGNPHVRARLGMAEHMAWARERPDGGRGFGFTGGHVHWNWGNPSFRTLVLNAIAWSAKIDVPSDGVRSAPLALEDLEQHQDFDRPQNYDREKVRALLESWNQEAAASR